MRLQTAELECLCSAYEKRDSAAVKIESAEQEPPAAATNGKTPTNCRSNFWCYAGQVPNMLCDC